MFLQAGMLGLKTDTRPKTKICLEYVQVYICTTSKLKGDNLSPKSEGRFALEKKKFCHSTTTAHTNETRKFYDFFSTGCKILKVQ